MNQLNLLYETVNIQELQEGSKISWYNDKLTMDRYRKQFPNVPKYIEDGTSADDSGC